MWLFFFMRDGVEHPTSFVEASQKMAKLDRAEQYNQRPKRSVGNGYNVGYISKEPQPSYWCIRNIVYY